MTTLFFRGTGTWICGRSAGCRAKRTVTTAAHDVEARWLAGRLKRRVGFPVGGSTSRPVHGSGLGCDPLELSCRGFRVECEVVGAFLRPEYRNNLALNNGGRSSEATANGGSCPGSPREIGTSDLQSASIGSWMNRAESLCARLQSSQQCLLPQRPQRCAVTVACIRRRANGFSRPPKNWATGEMLWHVPYADQVTAWW